MIWESWSAFWQMGGKGLYVWGSYGVSLLAVAVELFLLARRRKDTLRRLTRLRRAGREPRGAVSASPPSSNA